MKIDKRISLFERRCPTIKPEAFRICPRFERCSINKCPLHFDYSQLSNSPEDHAIKHKEKCVPKTIRKSIGTYFKLKNRGLKPREQAGEARWHNLTQEQRVAKILNLNRFARVNSEEGVVATRGTLLESQATLTNKGKTAQRGQVGEG